MAPPPKKRMRLDEIMLARGLVETIERARGLIMSGEVIVADQRIDKPGHKMDPAIDIRVREDSKYVSRGGDKLAAAIEDFDLSAAFRDTVVLDIGASTGGFTDCCLQHGAKHVVAIEVGTNQLAWKLRSDFRVTSIEKTDIQDYKPEHSIEFDWIVADVSFTSLTVLVNDIRRVAPRARMLLLVKPQFELRMGLIPKGGVVTNEEDRQQAFAKVEIAFLEAGIMIEGKKNARVAGRSGNLEIFVLARSGSV